MPAWIGLGSNQNEPQSQLCRALDELRGAAGIVVMRTSGFYRTAPWGVTDQDPFINAVTEIRTSLEPAALLTVLQVIEQHMGRMRSGDRWGPRCIDLDLLAYNDHQLETPSLELPHPRMHLRAFVLQPLLELDKQFVIPGLGLAADYLVNLDDQQVERLGHSEDICAGIAEHE